MQQSCKQQAAQSSTYRQADSEGRVPHSLISSIRKAPLPAVEFPISPSYSRLNTPHHFTGRISIKSGNIDSVISFSLFNLLTLFFLLLFDCTILSVLFCCILIFLQIEEDSRWHYAFPSLFPDFTDTVNTEIKVGSRIDEQHTSLKIQFSWLLIVQRFKVLSQKFLFQHHLLKLSF